MISSFIFRMHLGLHNIPRGNNLQTRNFSMKYEFKRPFMLIIEESDEVSRL